MADPVSPQCECPQCESMRENATTAINNIQADAKKLIENCGDVIAPIHRAMVATTESIAESNNVYQEEIIEQCSTEKVDQESGATIRIPNEFCPDSIKPIIEQRNAAAIEAAANAEPAGGNGQS